MAWWEYEKQLEKKEEEGRVKGHRARWAVGVKNGEGIMQKKIKDEGMTALDKEEVLQGANRLAPLNRYQRTEVLALTGDDH